jgi:hypothetical protein
MTAILLSGAVFFPGRAAQAEENSATGKVAIVAAQVEEVAKTARVCVEVSLSAVENAMAAVDDAESDVMNAMKAGDKTRIRLAEKKLEQAAEEAKEARDLAKKIIDYAAECSAAAVAAKEETAKLTADMSDRELASCRKRVNHLLEIARDALKKAETVGETLKKRWLLPVITTTSTTTTTTTTTTQPPTPTPVGRR